MGRYTDTPGPGWYEPPSPAICWCGEEDAEIITNYVNGSSVAVCDAHNPYINSNKEEEE